jgi:DNA polymerase-3 subunit gamma/tau
MLSNSAFNAFLKTLEEPPKHAKFILATTEKQKIIPTILSRCQVFNFNRIKTEDISNHLAFMANKEQVTFEPEALHVIAQKADGGLRDACSIFDQMVAFTGNNLSYKQIVENLNILDYDYYFKITDAFLSSNLPEIMVTFDNILKKGFDAHHFIIGLGEHLRNILVSKDPQTIVLIEVSESFKQNYLKQAQNCSINFLLKSLSIISKTDVNYKSAKNQRLLVEMALFQLTFLTVSADTEKKKDDLENVFENSSASNQKNLTPITKIEKESQIKYATKPIISIEQLKIKSGFSLNEIKTNIEVKPIILNTISEESTIINEIKTITNDDVKGAILKYAELKLIEGARQLSISLSTSEVQFENNVITITTNNEIQKEQLILEKHHVLDSLRSLLENNKITLEIYTSKIETKIKAFKPVDVFKDMAEKNPVITNLKKTFDLEIEY